MKLLFEIYNILKSKKIVMIGTGRRALDIQFMFHFNIDKYISLEEEENAQSLISNNEIIKAHLHNITECLSEDNTVFLICSYFDKIIAKSLESACYKRFVDYLLTEDIVKLLDFPQKLFENHTNILCVAGQNAEKAYCDFLDYYHTELDVVDYGEKKLNLCGKESSETSIIYIINNRAQNMERYLKSEGGYQYNKNLFVISPIGKRPSDFFMQMQEQKPLDMRICRHPFEFIEIVPSGDGRGISAAVDLCCPMFISECVGYLRDASFDEIWKGRMAQLQRLSVINRTFYFCNRQNCRYMKKEFKAAKEKEIDSIVSEKDYYLPIPSNPKHVAVDIDQTCNLRCKYCREEIHRISDSDKKILESVSYKIKNEIVPYCDELMLAGNGEVFASKYYLSILFYENKEGERKKLQLTTNALLLNGEMIRKMSGIYDDIELWISIDAASKETYESVRRNGKWEVLLEKLALIKKYREENVISFIRFNFIVTSKSYLEMLDFIEFAKKFKADSVLFQRLEKTNAISDEEFDKLSIFSRGGEVKEDYKEFLQNPVFNDPIINRENNVLHK